MAKTGNQNAVLQTIKAVVDAIGNVFKVIYSWCVRLHKLVLAVPVVVGAVYLAQQCTEKLPEHVGIGLQEDGTYSQLISRELAVMGPLAVTAICLLLMFCSRRTLYPWLISLFSLALPALLLITNIFPV